MPQAFAIEDVAGGGTWEGTGENDAGGLSCGRSRGQGKEREVSENIDPHSKMGLGHMGQAIASVRVMREERHEVQHATAPAALLPRLVSGHHLCLWGGRKEHPIRVVTTCSAVIIYRSHITSLVRGRRNSKMYAIQIGPTILHPYRASRDMLSIRIL